VKTLYDERFYRNIAAPVKLARFEVRIRQSDLLVFATQDLGTLAFETLAEARRELERYIEHDGGFKRAMSPYEVDERAPGIAREMAKAGSEYDVGPMAAVAGAIAERVGRVLLSRSQSVIVENGGDIFLALSRPARLRLYAGEDSPFADSIVFEVPAAPGGLGICTSSETVGHSFSYGTADAVVAVAASAARADAAATAIANRVSSPDNVATVIEEEAREGKLKGLIIAAGEKIGFWGDIKVLKEER
jgi:ApbE superfamily uncharacterized protein (UPF0280 family)